MSGLKRLLILAALLLSAFLMVGTAIIKHPKTQTYLHENLERIASEGWDGAITIGDLNAGLLPPHIELTEVAVIRHKNDVAPWLTLRRGVLKLSPWSLFKRTWVLDALGIEGLQGTIALDDPLFNSQDPKRAESDTRSSEFPLEIESIDLSSSSITVIHSNGALHLGEIEGRLVPQQEAHHLQVQLSNSTLTYEGQAYSIAGLAKGTIFGPIGSPEVLQIEGSELALNDFKTRIVGSIQSLPTPTLNLGLEIDGRLEQITTLHPQLQELSGVIAGSMRLKGSPFQPDIKLDLSLTSFKYQQIPPIDLELEGRYRNSHLQIEELQLKAPNGGHAQIKGNIELTKNYSADLDATLHNASLGHILHAIGLPNAWVRAPLSGNIHARGNLFPIGLDTQLALSLSAFESLQGSYTDPKSTPILQLRESTLNAELSIHPDRLSISRGVIQRGKSRLSLAGALHFNPHEGINIHFSSQKFNFKSIGSLAGIPFEGYGRIAGTLEGPSNDPIISATTELSDFAIDDYYVGTTKATLIYSDLSLNIPRLAIRVGKGRALGRGNLDFRTKLLETSGNLELENIPVGPLLDTIILTKRNAKRFEGTLSGRVIVEGPIGNPRGNIRLKSPNLIVDKSQLGPTTFFSRFGESTEKLSMKLKATPTKGTITANYALLNNNEIHFKANLDSVPMELLTPMVGNVPLKGSLRAKADLKGSVKALNGTIHMKATDFNAFGVALETTQLNGIATKGALRLRGKTLGKDADIAGNLLLAPNLPYSTTIRFQDLALERTHMIPKGPQYLASGSIFSQGKLTDANTIMADAKLEKLHIRIENTFLKQGAPIRILFSNQTFDFQDFRLVGDNVQLLVNGVAPLTEPLNLGIFASGSLAGVNGLWSELDFARGQFDIGLRIQGLFEAPSYNGSMKLTGGSIVRGNMQLNDLNTHLEFEEQTISIKHGRANIGAGTSDFTGTILLVPNAPGEVNVNATLNEIQVSPIPDLSMTLNGDLMLIGKSSDLELRGDLALQRMRYTANLDLEQFLRSQETPLAVPTFEPGNSWRLRINVSADNNLFVSNNVLEAELKTNLRITGTTNHVGAIGTITPIWAKANYAGNSYKIERAILDLTEEYKIFSQFDVLATTRACGMKLKVSLSGNSDRYVVEASGKDENGQVNSQDALLCAQFGVRLQNYAQSDSNTLRNTLPGAVDALWKVSGMDDRVRQLLPVVDELRLTSGYSKSSARVEPRVLMAKELGKDWELKYNGPIYYDDEQHVISLEYRLNSNATLESTWVSVSEVSIGDLGLDLRLKWEFE